jgi:hypothetical protein
LKVVKERFNFAFYEMKIIEKATRRSGIHSIFGLGDGIKES